MKYIITILIMVTAINANAGYAEKVRYWYSQNVSTNVPALEEIITMQDNSDGQGVHFTWHIANPPTKATIDAIDNAVAVAWAKDIEQTEETNYDKWSDKEKAMLKLLVKENNAARKWLDDFKVAVAASTSLANLQARVAALPNMPERTAEQVKNALKDELNN